MRLLKLSWSILIVLAVTNCYAQTDTLRIKTSAQCSVCKKKIEHETAYVKGVKSVNLNLKNKVITVVYNPEKTNPTKIRQAISMSGYDADSIPANKKAYDRLEDCCKYDGHKEEHK